MIDINKKYRTWSGLPVTLKGKDDFDYWYGFVHKDDGDEIMIWTNGGAAYDEVDQYALIEINEKEELIEEAKRRYPKGTIFLTPNYKHRFVSDGIVDDVHYSDGILYVNRTIVYDNGKWAEIVKEHTVEMYLFKNEYGDVFGNPRGSSYSNEPIAKKTITFYEGEGL